VPLGTLLSALSRCPAQDDLGGGNRLTDVTRGVLSGVEEETEDVRRQRLATDRSRLEELLTTSGANLREGRVDRASHLLHEEIDAVRRVARLQLALERSVLSLVELCPARVREKAVQAAGEVSEVVAEAGRAIWAKPQLIDGDAVRSDRDVLACLNEGMRRWLKKGIDPLDCASKPGFGHL
jgi:hypothetical protein